MKNLGTEDFKIYLCDAQEMLSSLDDGSIDLIFADPPYNIGKKFGKCNDKWNSESEYLNWCYTWLDLCIRKLKIDGSMYIMTSTQSMPYFDIYLRKRMYVMGRIIWSYDSSGVQAHNYYGSMYEPILFCVKDKNHYTFNAQDIMVEAKTGAQRKLIDYRKNPPQPYKSEKVPGNVWNFPRVRYRMEEYENHPTQKPISLLDRIIKASSDEGDVVVDPFGGTFTTAYVAKQLGRKAISCDIEKEYVKIGLRRLELATEFEGEQLTPVKKSYRKNTEQNTILSLFPNL